MNPLQRALIEKAGHDNGFENVLPAGGPGVELGSARHPAKVTVTASEDGFWGAIQSGSATLAQELARTFPVSSVPAQGFVLATEAVLARWLRRAAALSQALPNQAVVAFEAQLQQELAAMPESAAQNTEVLRMVRQRVGQQAYRQAMLDYWGGACAVTGLALPLLGPFKSLTRTITCFCAFSVSSTLSPALICAPPWITVGSMNSSVTSLA